MKKILLAILLCQAFNSYSQITRSTTITKKTTTDNPALNKTVLVTNPAINQKSSVASHAKITKNKNGVVTLQAIPLAIYGNNAGLQASRLSQYNGLSTEPSFIKNMNGVNVHYTIKKNPGYDNPPTTNSQKTGTNSNGNMNCTTYRESVSAQSSSFMSVSADGAGIYPGAIYTYNDFYSGSVLKSFGDGKRNPITIYTNNIANSTGDVAVNVSNPSASSINSAVAPIVRNFSTTTGSATSIGQYTYSNNNAALALNISAGGSYSGFSASAGFQINKEDKHIYITCDYKIPLYTLSTEIPVTGFFTDPNLEATPNLIMISSVMYGTRILANIDIDESSLSDSAFATFKYGDPSTTGAKAAFDFLKVDKNKKITINTYVVGVAPGLSPHPNTIDELLAQIDAVIRGTTYQTARPIGYTLADMAGNSLGVQSATDSYTVTNCVPKDAVYSLVSAKVDIQTGDDNKENGSNAIVELYYNGNHLVASQDGNTEFPGKQTTPMVLNIVNPANALLKNFQAGTNELHIFLDPKQIFLGWDAWDIRHVTLTLQFKDQNNVPYPGEIKIEMNNSNVRLEKNKQRLICYFNNQLQSTSSYQPQ